MSDEFTFTLNNPLTEEQWDMINDVDFDRTHTITFHTKHGKDVEFAKVKHGHWEFEGWNTYTCSCCGAAYSTEQLTALQQYATDPAFPWHCPYCGAKMDE